jgi:hypothetical protein
MSPKDESLSELERRLRQALAESVDGVDARVRSRLNQARQMAVAECGKPRWGARISGWMPAVGAVTAVLLVALLIGYPARQTVTWVTHVTQAPSSTEPQHPTAEDLELLTDGEGMDLVQSDPSDGSFYEWAMYQSDAGGAPGTGV